VSNFFGNQLQHHGVVGKWAARISTTVTEFLFTVVQTLLGFLRIAIKTPQVWHKVVYQYHYSVYIIYYFWLCDISDFRHKNVKLLLLLH